MKSILTSFLLLALVAISTPIVSADTSPDRTRALITRSTDVEDRSDRSRGNIQESTNENSNENNEEEGEGSGVVLDVSYGSDGQLEVNFNNGENSGNVNITVIINGETVSNTGSQIGGQGGGGGSTDGEDGNDGQDGTASNEDDDEDELEEPEVEEEEPNDRYDSRDARETFDRSPRR